MRADFRVSVEAGEARLSVYPVLYPLRGYGRAEASIKSTQSGSVLFVADETQVHTFEALSEPFSAARLCRTSIDGLKKMAAEPDSTCSPPDLDWEVSWHHLSSAETSRTIAAGTPSIRLPVKGQRHRLIRIGQ